MLDALYSSVKIIPPLSFYWAELCQKKSVFFEVILGRSALLFAPLSPLQTYPVPRGYKGSAMGRSKDANCRHIIEVENGFFEPCRWTFIHSKKYDIQ